MRRSRRPSVPGVPPDDDALPPVHEPRGSAGGGGAGLTAARSPSVPSLRTETPAGLLKTRELAAIVVLTQVLANVALSHGMQSVGPIAGLAVLPYLRALLNPWVAAGVFCLAVWMLANLALLSRADLSYVLPVTSISYTLVALMGHFLLGEQVSGMRWIGIVVITVGAMLVGGTQTRTVPDVLEREVPTHARAGALPGTMEEKR